MLKLADKTDIAAFSKFTSEVLIQIFFLHSFNVIIKCLNENGHLLFNFTLVLKYTMF